MDELIERLEKADDASQELDGEIALSLGWTFQKLERDRNPYWRKPGEARSFIREKLPAYTASLDAAMTLVNGRLSMLCQAHQPDMGGKQWNASVHDGGHHRARARTPALALCIAALRARGQQT